MVPTPASSRPYRKVARAKREAETRRRITEAMVELHGTLGPVHTTIADVARRAGVSRMTVYNHFPTEFELFMACSTHWASHNPFPDPSRWGELRNPQKRLLGALEELYRWYRLKQGMLGNVFRDTPVVPALAEVMESLWSPFVQQMVDALAEGWQVRKAHSDRLQAALHLSVAFETWRVLTQSGLDDDKSAELAARMVTAACAPDFRG